MKQKTMILTALATLAVLVGSCSWRIEKNFEESKGPKVTKTFQNLADFERIRIDGICSVYYTQGDTTTVKVVASDTEVMAKTNVASTGGWLDIHTKEKGRSNWRKKRSVSIYVTSPDLIEVDMDGVGSFKVDGTLDTDTLRLRLKGVGDMDFRNIICDRLEAYLKGVGDMNFEHLQTQQANLTLVGTGDIDAHFVKSGSVVCSLSGVGDIELGGEVRNLRKKVDGVGSINTKNLKVRGE